MSVPSPWVNSDYVSFDIRVEAVMDNTVLIPVPRKILKKNGLRLISLLYLPVNNKLYNCSNLFNTEVSITLTTLFDFSFQHYPHKIDENRKKEYLFFLFVCLF